MGTSDQVGISSDRLRHVESMSELPWGAGRISGVSAAVLGESFAAEEHGFVVPSPDFSARVLVSSPHQDGLEDYEDGGGSDDEEGGMRDEEMEELEKKYLNLRSKEQNLVNNLKRHKDEDALKGQAVKNQKALWDKTLEMRFLLQKTFSSSNKLPKESIKSRFCSYNQEIDQAYQVLMNSSKQTLSCILELQEALLEKNHNIQGTKDISSDSNGDNDDEWLQVQKMHCRIARFRNTEVDTWQRKTQVTTGAAALRGKLHAFNQNISDQVAAYMRDPSRMINRMYSRRSSVGVLGEDAWGSGSTKEEINTEADPELIDDSEFYHQLLKEFLESCDTGGSESAYYSLRKQQHKKRKVVDRRASKSRKIRYNVHEKIVNFMAPVPMVLPPMAAKLSENLFGLGNQKPTATVRLTIQGEQHAARRRKMSGFSSLAPKTKNLVVTGGLSAFVACVYHYTMRAVGSTYELRVAIDKFEEIKKKDAGISPKAGS